MQMVEGTIAEWLVVDGATVDEGQEIATVETDKVDAALEAPRAGTLKIIVGAGQEVPVGTLLAVIT